MIALIGICKGDYRKIEVVGQQVGCFEHKKVRELMNILNKYKLYFFRDQVFGLPDPGMVIMQIKPDLGKCCQS